MEASVATTEGAAAEPAAAEQATQGGGLDLSPVLERFDSLGGRIENIERLAERLGQGAGGAEGEPEPPEDEFDVASLLREDDDGIRGLDAQAMQELIDRRAEALLTDRLGPLSEQVRSIQVGLDAEQLTARYPDLAKPEVAEPVVKAARELAEALGQATHAQDARFIEVIYKAQMADKYAAGERPVGDTQGHELERAGGSGPSAGDEQPNIADRIVASRQKQEFWRQW